MPFMWDVLTRRIFSALDTTIAAARSLTHGARSQRGSNRWVDFNVRSWTSDLALSRQFVRQIQNAKWSAVGIEDEQPVIQWKGVPNIKDPFELAIVPLLLAELKPATVIELGSFLGGSAIWMADLLEAMGIDSRIYSFDIELSRITTRHPRVEFLPADCNQPSSLIGPWIKDRPHPWLLIEDAHVNTLGVMTELHPHLVAGDYWIVEDTAFKPWKYQALAQFMKQYGQHYRVDTRYTDLFGYNATFSFNGYLKRV